MGFRLFIGNIFLILLEGRNHIRLGAKGLEYAPKILLLII